MCNCNNKVVKHTSRQTCAQVQLDKGKFRRKRRDRQRIAAKK